jgi:hypothetical protein
MNKYATWFSHAVLVGVLVNIFGMALPFIFTPQWYLDSFGLPGGGASVLWMRQAGLLLCLVSLLYVPGGRDPVRYRLNATFATVGRMTIGLYWLYLVYVEGQTRAYLSFGFFDTIYAAFNALLLSKALKNTATIAGESALGGGRAVAEH